LKINGKFMGTSKMRFHRNNPGASRRSLLVASKGDETPQVRPTADREYIVPILFKAIQIIELLRLESDGLRIEYIHRMTGISRSTVYRIVRTLTASGYLRQDPRTVYKLAASFMHKQARKHK
jgi:DNA invertase Pin-like site-specific DNA recombinase